MENLQQLIIRRISLNLMHRFKKCSISSCLGFEFGLSACSLPEQKCPDVNLYNSPLTRIEHWERKHPKQKLRHIDCAWILSGGLLRWQVFKGYCKLNFPAPEVIKGKSLWSIEDVKAFVSEKFDIFSTAEREQVIWEQMRVATAEREQVIWEQMRVAAARNSIDWNLNIPELLNVSFDKCSTEKLKPLDDQQLFDLIEDQVTIAVSQVVPGNLTSDRNEVWKFIKESNHLEWLANFEIKRPADLYEQWCPESELNTWEELKKDADPYSEEWMEDKYTAAWLDKSEYLDLDGDILPHKIYNVLKNFSGDYPQDPIMLIQGISKDELYESCQFYERATENEITKIIVYPECDILDFYQLLLDQYEDDTEVTTAFEARRIAWEYILDGYPPVIGIAHAENLTLKIIKEIEDLQVRWGVSFVLATQVETDLSDNFIQQIVIVNSEVQSKDFSYN